MVKPVFFFSFNLVSITYMCMSTMIQYKIHMFLRGVKRIFFKPLIVGQVSPVLTVILYSQILKSTVQSDWLNVSIVTQ